MNFIAMDLDGTLEDSRDDMVAAVTRVRSQLGLPPRDAAALRPHVNRGMGNLYRACFDDFSDLERVRLAYEADYLANVADETRLYAGIAESVAALSKLARLAVVTNKPERISRELLRVLGLGDMFRVVVGGDTCSESKPSTVPLRAAADACSYDPERGRAFMIGDTAGDIRMGRAFGATTVWCAWGYPDQPGDEVPDLVAKAPTDLAALVRAQL